MSQYFLEYSICLISAELVRCIAQLRVVQLPVSQYPVTDCGHTQRSYAPFLRFEKRALLEPIRWQNRETAPEF